MSHRHGHRRDARWRRWQTVTGHIRLPNLPNSTFVDLTLLTNASSAFVSRERKHSDSSSACRCGLNSVSSPEPPTNFKIPGPHQSILEAGLLSNLAIRSSSVRHDSYLHTYAVFPGESKQHDFEGLGLSPLPKQGKLTALLPDTFPSFPALANIP